ncbi:hypothetical protein RRV45_10005 [Bacillus sp. DTU_2020_1000418_1_SI_GHA_SEK_038]|uniref:hypothetical protein n=1 Tax=Bacillus sp. DTU_2020_1000418_1_SI_GHA_SEK_038 TaxID=3077585 RepID=UPI0028E81F24|nr:hypothetical protein [Bacillus sp. DTU_2020_1000418_1_SI_GHA_SEK_038]WNS77295.1 hypothetical protein RRV45_10005 [Bacillus sp. DTU_2020_1000418_1_SI_GHA_SEK_038]
MEEILTKILHGMNDIRDQVAEISDNIKSLERRLDRLEKVDSIEHRIEVNQIDLSDIKDIVSKMESYQKEELNDFFQYLKGASIKIFSEELLCINQRLDAQLTKIAKNEEAILMMKEKNKVS